MLQDVTRSRPSRPTCRFAGAILAGVLALLAGVAPAAAQVRKVHGVDGPIASIRYDPRLRFRTISTRRFDIYFHQREEMLARRLAGFVEAVAAAVDNRLGAPHGRVGVILVDQTDQSNGWATVFPYNLIELAAVPPPSDSVIGNTDDWLRLVFAHEYTHVVHLEKTGGWMSGLRRVFGRVPVLFPNAFLPDWQVEGLATFEESVQTGQGRMPAGDFRLILDRAAAAGRFAPLDRAGGSVIDWPSGHAAYLYGVYFHEYLARRYGPASLARLAEATSRSLPFLGSRAYRRVFGRALGMLWNDFENDASRRLTQDDEEVRATRRTMHGFNVRAPHFTRDGRLFYSVANPHGFPAIMELRGNGLAPRRVATRYHGDRMSSAGGTLVFSQLEVVRHGDVQSDLYAVDVEGGGTRRVTREARAADADVAPDGRTIVCTVQAAGRRLLATLAMPVPGEIGRPVPLVSEDGVEFSAPRWSPDGRFIAAERRQLGGGSDIVVVEVATGEVRTVAGSARGRNVGPVWLPDGSGLLFSSDRDGASFRIYAAETATGIVRRLRGTGADARTPVLSPDGGELVFVASTADGYDLHSLPFDLAEWSAPIPAAPGPAIAAPAAAGNSADVPRLKDSPYSPWPTLAPRYWVPLIETRNDDLFLGAATSGFDALGRHAYIATGAWAVPRNRPDWQLDYTYSRWSPTLFARASDTVAGWRDGERRSRELTAGALLPVRRVRWSSTTLAAFHASRDVLDCPTCETPVVDTARRSAVQLGWSLSNAKSFGYSVSAEEGAGVSVTGELARRALGGDGDAGAAVAEARGYWRMLPRHAVVAARVAGATSWGDRRLRRVFDAAGSGAQSAGFDVGPGAIGLVRGFSSADLFGFHAAVVNLDYRFPIAWPQRGVGTWPVMLRSIHGALFADAGQAWDGSRANARTRQSFGVELSADTVLGYSLPLTLTAGGAWREDPSGKRRGWGAFARVGRAF